MSKFFACTTLVALLSIPMGTKAADFTDLAEVVSVTPIKEFVNEPRRECWSEPVTEYREYREHQEYRESRRHSPAGALLGGLAGGALGRNVGGGNARHAGAALGAVIGAIVGDRIDNHDYYVEPEIRREPVTRYVERCKSYDRYQGVIKRYHVVYRYNGREGEASLPYDPGSHVRVGVQAIEGEQAGSPRTRE